MRSRKPDTSHIDRRNAEIDRKKREKAEKNKRTQERETRRAFSRDRGRNLLITTSTQGLGE